MTSMRFGVGLDITSVPATLHAGALHVQNQLQGCFPRTSEELQQLPGACSRRCL